MRFSQIKSLSFITQNLPSCPLIILISAIKSLASKPGVLAAMSGGILMRFGQTFY